jgi:hypothetical protein
MSGNCSRYFTPTGTWCMTSIDNPRRRHPIQHLDWVPHNYSPGYLAQYRFQRRRRKHFMSDYSDRVRDLLRPRPYKLVLDGE